MIKYITITTPITRRLKVLDYRYRELKTTVITITTPITRRLKDNCLLSVVPKASILQ